MKVFFNDEPREVDEPTTIAALLGQWDVNPRHVAVEVNYTLIPRGRHEIYTLKDGDRLEVVTLVGGG